MKKTARINIMESLASALRRPDDDVYVDDLAFVIKAVTPVLFKMLHAADGFCELTFANGTLYMITDSTERKVLP